MFSLLLPLSKWLTHTFTLSFCLPINVWVSFFPNRFIFVVLNCWNSNSYDTKPTEKKYEARSHLSLYNCYNGLPLINSWAQANWHTIQTDWLIKHFRYRNAFNFWKNKNKRKIHHSSINRITLNTESITEKQQTNKQLKSKIKTTKISIWVKVVKCFCKMEYLSNRLQCKQRQILCLYSPKTFAAQCTHTNEIPIPFGQHNNNKEIYLKKQSFCYHFPYEQPCNSAYSDSEHIFNLFLVLYIYFFN